MKCVDCKFFEPYAGCDGAGWCRVYDATRCVDSEYKCGKPAKGEHSATEQLFSTYANAVEALENFSKML